jgi:hypothetical protein
VNLRKIGAAVVAVGTAMTAFVVGGGAAMPREIVITRRVEIAATPQAVHAWVGDLSRWGAWTPWNTTADPSLKLTITGAATAVGGTMAWHGDRLGDGRLTLTEAQPTTGVRYDLWLEPERFPAKGEIRYESLGTPENPKTAVTWTDTTDLGANPLTHWFGPAVTKAIGDDFDAGLATLQKQIEGTPAVTPTAPPHPSPTNP